MQDILDRILNKMPLEARQIINQDSGLSQEKILEAKCTAANNSLPEVIKKDMENGTFNLDNYLCPSCNNKGVFYYPSDGEVKTRLCDCLQLRRSMRLIEKSGLKGLIEDHTFENYKIENALQRQCYQSAKDFVEDILTNKKPWFFISGQSGSGKTHLCTAIAGELLNNGKSVHYMRWKNDIPKLKANVNNYEPYNDLLKPILEAGILYIDDFLKTAKGENKGFASITDSDLSHAYTIIDSRMIANKPTIISTELSSEELYLLDEAMAGRIIQRTNKQGIFIPRTIENNYRLR